MRRFRAILAVLATCPSLAWAQTDRDGATPDSHDAAQPATPAQPPSRSAGGGTLTDGATAGAYVYVAPPRREPPRVLYFGGPIPAGMRRVTHRNRALLVAGSVGFGAGYLSSAAVASVCASSTACGAGVGWLFLPVVGPFITLTYPQNSEWTVALLLDGILQAGGVGIAIAGLLVRKYYLEPDPEAETSARRGPQWTLGPFATGAAAGLSFSMTY